MEKKYISDISLQKNAPLFNHICAAFSLWHNLYEELKLNTLNTNLKEFAKFLHYLSEVFSLSSHVKIYETDFPCIKSKADTVYNLKEEFSSISEKCQQIKGFSLINHALDIFNNNNMDEPPPKHSHRMKYSTVLMKIFATISKYTQSTSSSSDPEEMLAQLKLAGKESLVDTIINIMLKEGFTADDLDKLPIGYQIPIKEIFHHTRSTNQIAMSLETAMFLGREDIVSLKQLELKENTNLSSKLKPSHDEDDKDGMLIDEQMFEIRFKDDLRVHEVKRLLNSSVPVTVSVEQKPDMNDHAFAKEEESKLLILSKRTMSLSVARGMLTLGTAEPKSSKAVIIPTLDLSGRSSTSNKTVQIPQSDLNALLLWPNFHNGVAAGLKIARENCKVDSTWILLNKLKYSELNASHSGFLFALGLMGHLSSLPKLHLHDYLIKGHALTTVALLIGTAATKIGTKNTDAYKLLCLHLDSLLPPTALELNIPRISQTASALSLGLLFFGTGDLHLVKILLREIGKPPGVEIESSNDRESHALSAGLALGMIMIGQGTDNMKILDWDVFNLLYNYINRGKKNELIPGYNDSSQNQGSFQIFEGDTVNTDVTAPAAIMALALLYLKTNNLMVANSVKVIVSEATMDSLKPDHVLYRMLSFNLIMWDTLVPTLDWMEEIVPGYAELLESLQSKSFLMIGWTQELYYRICAISGSFLALSLKFAASCNAHAFNMMLPWLKIIRKLRESSYSEEVGGKVILEQCLNTVLVSLSILMAGSGNITILKMARQLRKRTNDVSYGNHMAIHMAIGFLFLGGGRYTLKTDDIAIASLLCAVYPKWPISSKDNRFHLQALRHLYVLACEPRLFVTRDVDNKNICYTPIEVTLKETLNYPESRVKMLSPCFIPESKYIKKITTLGPRYLSIALTVPKKNNQLWLDQIQNIFVKKKAGYLSYAEDPKGFRNLLGRTFTNQSEKLECVKAFSSATNVVLFEEMFCHSKDGDKKYAELFSNILYECVRQEKLDVLNRYLAIEKIIRDIENNRLSVYDFQQLRLLFSYYNNTHHKLLKMNYVSKTPLISGLYMMQCRIRCENQFQKIENLGFGSTRPLNFEIIKELSNSM
uniref:Anaphase-promoting complex subunit 1 n=1 Tax=Clytia hemisphaerica TaxID=252671 RepID=A0A7M5XES7_9CNID